MNQVGDELVKDALARTTPLDIDAFGRSAFNRYYYGCFLVVRDVLTEVDASWKQQSHKTMPSLLRGALRERIRRQIVAQEKRRLIPRNRASALRTDLQEASEELARLMELGYKTRVVADYHPEVTIVREGTELRLQGQSATSAAEWHRRAARFSKTILRVSRDVGLL